MSSQLSSVAERLCRADSPRDLVDWEQKDGYYVETCSVSKDDTSALISLVNRWSDPDWSAEDLGLDPNREECELLPVTAWRTLADLKSVESVEPLLSMLCELDPDDDDWSLTELPHVFGKIGKPSIQPLLRLANDVEQHDRIRTVAAEGLQRVAEYHVETRDEIVACLTEMMANASPGDIEFNSTLLVGLVDLGASEAAEAIERAFANDALDVGMIGDWQHVRRRLGVEGLGLEMPKHPHNFIEEFRRRMGIGIFSDKAIFDEGDVDPYAEQAYYERAWDLFSKSKEAEQFIDRFGRLGRFRMLLDFGVNYLGEIVDEMTLASVQEFLFDYVPRKVSTEAESAASIVFELTMFWKFAQRVYELPEAQSIIDWLRTDGLVAELREELSDPANFGMAKSMVMAGQKAGYDMTSEEGMAQFMAAYNQSLLSQQSGTAKAPTSSVATGGKMKVGRNDPCPCGSGKKFKKCCR